MFAPGSKRTLTVLTFITLGFTLLGVFVGLIPPSEQANTQASLLFALHGGRGYLMADKTSPTGYKLLIAETEPHTIWFTDRPDRQSGTMLTAALAQEWPSFFPDDDEPNAVIMASGVDDPRQSVIEIGQPVYEPRIDGLLANVSFVGEDNSLRPAEGQEVEIGPIDLFIDDAVVDLSLVNGTTPTSTGSSDTTGQTGGAPNVASPAPAAAGGNTGTGSNGGNGGNGGAAPLAAGSGGNGGNGGAAPLAAGSGGNGGNGGAAPVGKGGNGGQAPLTLPKSGVAARPVNDPDGLLDWSFHSVIPNMGETAGKYVAKTRLANNNINNDSMSNYIYSIPASVLVSNFSDHHLDLISSTGGVTLAAHTIINDTVSE